MKPIRSVRLSELGFSITEDGKHYKVRYHDDSRYLVTISKQQVIVELEIIIPVKYVKLCYKKRIFFETCGKL